MQQNQSLTQVKELSSLSQLIKQTAVFFSDYFKEILILTLIAQSLQYLSVLLNLLNIDFTKSAFENVIYKSEIVITFSMMLDVLQFILSILGLAMLIFFLQHPTYRMSISSLFQSARSRFWDLLWTIILQSFILIGATLLFIIPGIILSISMMFTSYIVIHEKTYGWAAIKRSRKLVRGYWLEIFSRYLFILLLSLLLLSPALLITQFIKSFQMSIILADLYLLVLSTLLIPFMIIYGNRLYQELKEIKAG